MKRALTRFALLALASPLLAAPAFAHWQWGYKPKSVPEIDVMQGGAAVAVVIATLFLLRELWVRRKRRSAEA
jgi:hypothetical protein